MFKAYAAITILGLIGGIIYPLLGDIKNGLSALLSLTFLAAWKGEKGILLKRKKKLSFFDDCIFFLLFGLFFFLIDFACLDLTIRFSMILLCFVCYVLGYKEISIMKNRFSNDLFDRICMLYFNFILKILSPIRNLIKWVYRFFLRNVFGKCQIACRKKISCKILRKKQKAYSIFLLTRAR